MGQGVSPFDAASLAVFLHADAGNRATKEQGSAGMIASDVLKHLPLAGRALAGEEPPVSGGLGFGNLQNPGSRHGAT